MDSEIRRVYKYASKLKYVERTGWINRKVKGRIESDAEHSFLMSNIAMLLNAKFSLDLDMVKVYEMININDYGESIIGDIPLKTNITKEEKHSLELNAIKEIFKDKTFGQKFLNLWLEFEEGKTKEAIFVSLLDRYQAVMQAYEYSKIDNREDIYIDFYTHYQTVLKERKDILTEDAKLLVMK